MFLRKWLAPVALSAVTLFLASAADANVVNFSTCISGSKYGKKEQENYDNLRKQLSGMIDDTEKELKDLSTKLEDSEYLDSLSPKAEEELKTRFQTLNDDLSRYQNQFYQVMQQANMQILQRMTNYIAKASETVAKEKKLDTIINKEACFYFRPDLDITNQVISRMDENFEIDLKTKKISDNSEESATQPEAAKEKTAG